MKVDLIRSDKSSKERHQVVALNFFRLFAIFLSSFSEECVKSRVNVAFNLKLAENL